MYTLVAYVYIIIHVKKKKTHKITIKIYKFDFYSEQAVFDNMQSAVFTRETEREREINIFLARFQNDFYSIVGESINA